LGAGHEQRRTTLRVGVIKRHSSSSVSGGSTFEKPSSRTNFAPENEVWRGKIGERG